VPLPSEAAALADLLARLQSALAERYSIERELGASGMATVYLAEDIGCVLTSVRSAAAL
jgi:hypothetical protein